MKKAENKKKQILERMQRYCAREDRSAQKVKEKLYQLTDISENDRNEIIDQLFLDKFLDEERFTTTYIRSKINQNQWGRIKIRHGLIRHRIPEELIDKGLEVLNTETYQQNLNRLLKTKQKTSDDSDVWVRYLLQKGYEYEEILEAIKR